jgi:reverse gyrase
VHGERGEALTKVGRMEGEMDKGNKEAMYPIMMEEDHINNIMETTGKMSNGVPYQYKMNNKKRPIADREGLECDEEEVEDLRVVNSNLVQYLLQTDIQKRTEKIQWQIQTLHRDFSPGNPNWENQHILYSYNCVTLFTIQYTYRSQRHPKP